MSAQPTAQPPLIRRRRLITAALGALAASCLSAVPAIRADHEGINGLTFAAPADSPSPAARGSGRIEYHGESEPVSRWTSTFDFTGLEPQTAYLVMVMGRTGEDGSAAALALSPICLFQSDAAGAGQCWDYGLGMRRIGIIQLRRDDEAGPVVLQATRAADGIGSILSVPNQFSPPTPSPLASPPPPLGSPIAG